VLVLLMAEIHDVFRSNRLSKHNMHTNFHNDRYRYSSNPTVIILRNSEASKLVLMAGGINEVGYSDCLRWHDIHTKFHEDWFRNTSNIKVITSTI
jgi:hypothetical protein